MNRVIPRSLLFVPGDSERKQAKALVSGADALILDLEDSVAVTQLSCARRRVRELLNTREAGGAGPQTWVRVNSLLSGNLLDDLAAVMTAGLHGVVLPKVCSPEQVIEVGHYLSALETREGLRAGSTRIIVIATETPRAVLTLQKYQAGIPRLTGLAWGVEDLSSALGGTATMESSGAFGGIAELARSMCLLAAGAAGVAAFDAVNVDFRDAERLSSDAARAHRDGFAGKMAIHPDQIATINAAFTPSPAEIADARRIVDAFAAAADAGVVNIGGRMFDRPHLARAQRTLDATDIVPIAP